MCYDFCKYIFVVIGKWTTPWLILVVLCLTDVVQCDLCRGPVCEYKFVFRRSRTMTYADGNNVFNVALYRSRLQIVENVYRYVNMILLICFTRANI